MNDHEVGVTLTPERIKLYERAMVIGLPAIVVSMYGDRIQKLLDDERNKVAQWMIDRGYATGHGDTTEDLLQELEWQIAENWTRGMVNGVQAEREACAAIARQWDVDHQGSNYGGCIARLIEARGQA
jgi:hypothetical protein